MAGGRKIREEVESILKGSGKGKDASLLREEGRFTPQEVERMEIVLNHVILPVMRKFEAVLAEKGLHARVHHTEEVLSAVAKPRFFATFEYAGDMPSLPGPECPSVSFLFQGTPDTVMIRLDAERRRLDNGDHVTSLEIAAVDLTPEKVQALISELIRSQV